MLKLNLITKLFVKTFVHIKTQYCLFRGFHRLSNSTKNSLTISYIHHVIPLFFKSNKIQLILHHLQTANAINLHRFHGMDKSVFGTHVSTIQKTKKNNLTYTKTSIFLFLSTHMWTRPIKRLQHINGKRITDYKW